MALRDVAKLALQPYDVLVIGGGITGACIAWDATLRGLRVALVERDDFGAATSANSLKTVHGGLRYLQDADLAQVRKMVRERQAFLRIAPHLVRPLPCLMPTYQGSLMRHKAVMGIALKLNDLLSLDRNWGMDPARRLPAGRILSRRACLSRLPGMDDPEISGGVTWYDAQIHNTERMLLSFLLSAAHRGAELANYVEVVGLVREGHRVVGAEVEERLTGKRLQLRARVVVNAAGPWVDEIVGSVGQERHQSHFNRSVAINLVTRQILAQPALGLNSRYVDEEGEECSRVLFIAPWREYSIVGTLHMPYSSATDGNGLGDRVIEDFLQEVNRAFPPASLQRHDVSHVHFGYLPAEDSPSLTADSASLTAKLVRKAKLTDHSRHGVDGLITVVGVKFTTARHLAQQAVDLVFEKLGRPIPACQTRSQRLYGGAILDWEVYSQHAIETMTTEEGLSRSVAMHLIDNYGSAHREIVSYRQVDRQLLEPLGAGSSVTGAEVVHAVCREMAVTLSDVVYRRTELGSAGRPEEEAMERCAEIMAEVLGWGRERIYGELDKVYAGFTTEGTEVLV